MARNDSKVDFDPTPLKRAKLIKGLRLADIAKRAGTSISTVSLILNGDVINSRALGEVCDVLGVSRESLFPAEAHGGAA